MKVWVMADFIQKKYKIHREVWLMRKKKFIDQNYFLFFDYSAFFKYSQN